jgi:hypothetical protein
MLHIGLQEGACDLKEEDLTTLTVIGRLTGPVLENLPFKIFTLASRRLPQRIRVGGDTFVYLCEEIMSTMVRGEAVKVEETVEVDDVVALIVTLRKARNKILLVGNCYTWGFPAEQLWFSGLAVYIKVSTRRI